ncbi:unnamed protein product [Caretta caretta]
MGLLSSAAYITLVPLTPETIRPLAASAGNITALGVSTGYEWNSVLCGQDAACGALLLSPGSCLCWTAESTGHCQPPLPSTTENKGKFGAKAKRIKQPEACACF